MSTPRSTTRRDRPSLAPWAWLGGAALVVLAAGAVAAGVLGDASDVVLVLVGGSAAVGLLGVLLPALVAPVDPLGRPAAAGRGTGPGLGAGGAGFGVGFGGGDLGGGGSGGGDCGGGGGSSC